MRKSPPLVRYRGRSKPAQILGTDHSFSSLAACSGYSLSYVQLVFTGKRRPARPAVEAFARCLNVPADDLAARLGAS